MESSQGIHRKSGHPYVLNSGEDLESRIENVGTLESISEREDSTMICEYSITGYFYYEIKVEKSSDLQKIQP